MSGWKQWNKISTLKLIIQNWQVQGFPTVFPILHPRFSPWLTRGRLHVGRDRCAVWKKTPRWFLYTLLGKMTPPAHPSLPHQAATALVFLWKSHFKKTDLMESELVIPWGWVWGQGLQMGRRGLSGAGEQSVVAQPHTFTTMHPTIHFQWVHFWYENYTSAKQRKKCINPRG